MRIKPKKAQAFVFIVFLIAIFVLGFAYVTLSKPMQYTYNEFYNDTDVQDQVYQDFFIRSKTIWTWITLPISIGLILWVMIEIQKKRNDYGEI